MTARYKPYPQYKPSGVEWLGDVPGHWDVQRIGALMQQRHESNSGPKTENILSVMKDIGVIPYDEKGDVGNKKSEDIERYQVVHVGDLVVNSMNVIIGSVGISRYYGALSPVYHVLYPPKNSDISPEFVGWAFSIQTFQRSLKRLGYGILEHRLRIPMDNLKLENLPVPPLPEQRAIAAFLDRETGKIDRMIGKQERMIELLKEKRQAAISNAVTKGLDPTAPMKDSGIEWLGQIPEHWKALQLRHCLNGMEQGKSPSCENRMTEEGEWGVLKSGCVNRGEFNHNEHKALPSTIEPFPEYEVKKGDLLMSRASGSRDLIGSVGYVSDVKSGLLLSDKTFRLKNKPLADKLFLSHEMSSQVVRRQIELAINGAEGLANNITQSSIRSFYIALPPIAEQKVIVQFLESETAKIDRLISKAEQAIELMKERRTALISAAVTGKIDVRSVTSNAYCVTDDTPELMAAEEQAEYRVKE